MPQILIRKVPDTLHETLKQESYERRIPLQQLVLETLQHHYTETKDELLPSVSEEVGAYANTKLPFSFIDLFAGIGGFRTAMECLGGRCLFSSEWDLAAQRTYNAWYGETPHGDITKIKPAAIPSHDILCAGFPCQPFSIAGVSKKNSLGRKHGFKDETQGTLFFSLASIIEIKRPPVAILENVKNLASHDKGRTWSVIKRTLEDLDYTVHTKIIDARFWLPQHRERIFIVCFDKHVFGPEVPFSFPEPPTTTPKLRDILEESPDPKYTLSEHLWNYLQDYAAKHKEKGNGFGYGLADLDGCTRTLSARYYKDGSEILIPQDGKPPRRLTPRECQRLMGYPERKIPVSDTQAYKQFGNSVVPAVVEAVGVQVLKVISWHLARRGTILHEGSMPRLLDEVGS